MKLSTCNRCGWMQNVKLTLCIFNRPRIAYFRPWCRLAKKRNENQYLTYSQYDSEMLTIEREKTRSVFAPGQTHLNFADTPKISIFVKNDE